jgi:hypothetical protein
MGAAPFGDAAMAGTSPSMGSKEKASAVKGTTLSSTILGDTVVKRRIEQGEWSFCVTQNLPCSEERVPGGRRSVKDRYGELERGE